MALMNILDMPPENPPVGTLVLCERGHRICEIVGPISDRHGTALSAGLGNWTAGQQTATRGDSFDKMVCSRCGTPYCGQRLVKLSNDRRGAGTEGTVVWANKIHLSIGWWPYPGDEDLPPDTLVVDVGSGTVRHANSEDER